MEHQFWHDKWETGDLAFHQQEYNPLLVGHWRNAGLPVGSKVFVPLCGKSGDMLWLLEQGHEVLGVELNETAAQSFFDENGLEAARDEAPPFIRYHSDQAQILCGDFFSLTPSMLQDVVAVYDRGSLIAMPADMRAQYAAKMRALLQPGVQILLITVMYAQGRIDPPPFRVSEQEINELYRPWCEVELLEETDVEIQEITCSQLGCRLQVRA